MPVSRNRGAFEGIGRASPKIDASQSSSPSSTPGNALGASPLSYFGGVVNDSFSLDTPNSDSSGSGHANPSHKHIAAAVDAIVTSQASDITNLGRSEGPASQKNFVGTPDYLAPESILGIGMDARVDWVCLFSLAVILLDSDFCIIPSVGSWCHLLRVRPHPPFRGPTLKNQELNPFSFTDSFTGFLLSTTIHRRKSLRTSSLERLNGTRTLSICHPRLAISWSGCFVPTRVAVSELEVPVK